MIAFSVAAAAQDGQLDGRLFAAALPGGMRSALTALDDRVAPDRSQFLPELIRRFHFSPISEQGDPRLARLQSLLALLEAPHDRTGSADPVDSTVPLPLPPEIWIDTVFGGNATPESLVAAILRTRNASLLYCGLLSLDDETRRWLAGKPSLIAYLADHAATFLVAAPGLRVKDGRMQPPGGRAADPIWRALARETEDPEAFIRAALELRRGHLAYFIGSLGQLTNAQVAFALQLESPSPEARVAAATRVLAAFEQVAGAWVVDRHPFSRPAFDPALLLTELPEDEQGRPILPASRSFWSEVFPDSRRPRKEADVDGGPARLAGGPVGFDWLCERVFSGSAIEQRRRWTIVLFASRHIEQVTRGGRDAIDAVRAAGEYHALIATLERAGLTDMAVFAAAGRRAAALSSIRDRSRAARALSQFQGALALLTRAEMRRGLPAGSLPPLVSSLCAVGLTERGDYDGGVLRWLDAHLTFKQEDPVPVDAGAEPGATARAPLERQLLWRLAGAIRVDPSFVDWEGTRYRVDLSTAESTRLSRLLGTPPPSFFTSARVLLDIADTFERRAATKEQRRAAADALAEVDNAIGSELQTDDADRYRDITAAIRRVGEGSDVRERADLARAVRELADSLVGRALVDLAYVVAFGQPGAAAISPREAARRHDFGLEGFRQGIAWQLPQAGGGGDRAWHVTGSILGLDVKLAQFSLMRISARPPARSPSVVGGDRTVFVEAVGLVEPAALSGSPADAAVDALRRGRERVAAARTLQDVLALADEIRLSAARRALLAWAADHEPERVSAFFSFPELLWLGAKDLSRGMFDPWGAPAEPRLGCLCLRLIERRPWELFAGRWHTGMLASLFPDLNLRLAELLADLRMPASLLPAVLAPATVDLVENAERRDQDDRRGLVEFVQSLTRERVEEYLALLTTDGPLLPVADALDPLSNTRNPR